MGGRGTWQVTRTQTLANYLCNVTAVAKHASRTTLGTTALSLQGWDGVDKGERLLRVISVCSCGLDCEWDTLTVADQMTFAAEFGATVGLEPVFCPPKTAGTRTAIHNCM
jgi:hypothetical protein